MVPSRGGVGQPAFQGSLERAETAKAPLDSRPEESSGASNRERWQRFMTYVLAQRWWIFPGGLASVLMWVVLIPFASWLVC